MSSTRRRRGQAQEAAVAEQVEQAAAEQAAAVEPQQQQAQAVNGDAAVEAPQAPAANFGVDQGGNAVVVEPIVAAAPGLAPPVPLEPMEPVAPIPGLNLLGLFNLLQPQGFYNPGQLNNPNGNPPFQALPLPPIDAQPSGGRGARFRRCKRLIKESLDRREALGSAILQNARAKEEELLAMGLDCFDDCQDVLQLAQTSRAALDVAQDVEGDGAQQAQQENNGASN